MRSVKVRFLRTYTVKAQDGPTYFEGAVHELQWDAAQHFIRRKVAKLLDEPQPQWQPPAKIPTNLETREITTDVDLKSLFARARAKEGIIERTAPGSKPAQGVEAQTADDPLVTCIMPTRDRREFVPAAIECFLGQTYQKRELLVVDDGKDSIRDLVPKGNPQIRYARLKKHLTTGAKRNKCCDLALGEIICHWDDDDWSAPDRIEDQVRRLQDSGLPITGYAMLLFWDAVHQEARRYSASVPGYVTGTSLCYLKSYWKEHPFPNKQIASDNDFVYPALKQIAVSQDITKMVARLHDRHTSAKTGIGMVVEKELVPLEFWENEKLRIKNREAV